MIINLTYDNLDILDNSFINKDELKKEFDNNPFIKVLLYLEDNRVLGYLYYSDIYERAEINQFEVDINSRNKGIGTKLLEKMINNTNKPITLEVREDNDSAINLYKKFSFIPKAKRLGYYNGIDGILMERSK